VVEVAIFDRRKKILYSIPTAGNFAAAIKTIIMYIKRDMNLRERRRNEKS
jgi:hypothetical protein